MKCERLWTNARLATMQSGVPGLGVPVRRRLDGRRLRRRNRSRLRERVGDGRGWLEKIVHDLSSFAGVRCPEIRGRKRSFGFAESAAAGPNNAAPAGPRRAYNIFMSEPQPDVLRIDETPTLTGATLVLALTGWMDGGDVSTGTVRRLVEAYRTFREVLPGARIYHLEPPLAVPAGALRNAASVSELRPPCETAISTSASKPLRPSSISLASTRWVTTPCSRSCWTGRARAA